MAHLRLYRPGWSLSQAIFLYLWASVRITVCTTMPGLLKFLNIFRLVEPQNWCSGTITRLMIRWKYFKSFFGAELILIVGQLNARCDLCNLSESSLHLKSQAVGPYVVLLWCIWFGAPQGERIFLISLCITWGD